ncbi:ubiquitin-associated domain-containing family protein [Hibiscus syriacus]|uniref:Ubiquitin-associated domain-containing family protein n=1 Tax=Hibiscus syriacus TaxID=106335 RepID=A0A6A3CU57_HIBSY|nr:uncharacterized protein LOC120161127 [Hibiscus syriacus]KAE8730768.1 ubiquitin-associated domain-containing family protein [Hibiscus syriacus]
MDWYSWLSKTGLHPSLVYTYGFAFSGNELQKGLAYLNHEFLQSMGISVAKHRLEILKLARKEISETSNGQSKLISAVNKIRKYSKYVNKLVHQENNTTTKALPAPAPVSYREKWREALSKKDMKIEHPLLRTRRTMAKSGPLDYRGQEKLLVTPRSLKL